MSDLLKMNIGEMSLALREKKISSAELTKAYIASIEKNKTLTEQKMKLF